MRTRVFGDCHNTYWIESKLDLVAIDITFLVRNLQSDGNFDCPDGSDESDSNCNLPECDLETHFFCLVGKYTKIVLLSSTTAMYHLTRHKVGYVFPIVVGSMLPHAKLGPRGRCIPLYHLSF